MFNNIKRDLKLEESTEEMNALIFATLNYFGVSKTDVISDKPVDLDYSKLSPVISRLNQHEPLQYILNEAWFYGRNFFVDPSVLIPRPETELIVEESKKVLCGAGGRILDIGTGSGCIALSIALEFPQAIVTGIDVSEAALEIARKNAKALDVPVAFQKADILNGLPTDWNFDLIVSNPPYISVQEKSSLPENVIRHEPHLALFASETDPLVFYRAIAKAAKQTLRPNGVLIVEINEHFGGNVKTIFNQAGFAHTQIIKDFYGKDRVISAQIGR